MSARSSPAIVPALRAASLAVARASRRGEVAGDVAGAAQVFLQRVADDGLDQQRVRRMGEGQCALIVTAAAGGGDGPPAFAAIAFASASVRKVRCQLDRSAENRCGNGRRGFPGGPAPRPATSLAVAVMLSSAGSLAPARSIWAMMRERFVKARAHRAQGRQSGSWPRAAPAAAAGRRSVPARAACRAPCRRDCAADVFRRPRAEHQRFEQRVGGQPVGAVQAGGGAFADGPQTFQRRAAARIRGDAAHVVMRGGRHRDRLRRRIDARRAAGGIDGGKRVRRNSRRWPRGNRGRRLWPGAICAMDGAGHDIARRELGIG